MRVFVISAYPTVRAGLRALVQAQPGWMVVGEGGPTPPAGERTRGARDVPLTQEVDVVLADAEGPVTVELLDRLVESGQPRAGVVLVGAAESDRGLAGTLGEELAAGWPGTLGLGLLPRDAAGEEIVSAVEAVANGLVVLDRRLARGLMNAARAGAVAGPGSSRGEPGGALDVASEPLTARELEVLQLLAEGLPNKIIASRLHVSEHTAKFHVASIMTKLGAASRTEAVTLAARRGLLIL